MEEEQKKEKQRNSESAQDFRMVYQTLINDIENTKRRQWAATYYLLVLFAAIMGFSKTIALDKIDYFCCEKAILLAIATAIAIFGTSYLCYLQKTINRYRKRKQGAISHLSPDYKKFEEKWFRLRYAPTKWYRKSILLWKKNKDKDWREKPTSWRSMFELTIYLILMLWIAWGFVFWYLFLLRRAKPVAITAYFQ